MTLSSTIQRASTMPNQRWVTTTGLRFAVNQPLRPRRRSGLMATAGGVECLVDAAGLELGGHTGEPNLS